MDYIKALTDLEPTFRQAGELAVKMQSTAKHHNKTNTGWNVTDIVTDADVAVQEFLLEAICKTDLVNCRLLAEENTVPPKQFSNGSKFILGIDPIDGTAVYARGGKYFSVIISLHDDKNLLYTFKYFPVFNWTLKIVGFDYFTSGQEPNFKEAGDCSKKIFYYTGNPEKNIPDVYRDLTAKGFMFEYCGASTADVAEVAMFMSGKAAGFYTENPNAYDGLCALHCAVAKKLHTYSSGENGHFDLNNIQKRETGFFYPGYYLALNS